MLEAAALRTGGSSPRYQRPRNPVVCAWYAPARRCVCRPLCDGGRRRSHLLLRPFLRSYGPRGVLPPSRHPPPRRPPAASTPPSRHPRAASTPPPRRLHAAHVPCTYHTHAHAHAHAHVTCLHAHAHAHAHVHVHVHVTCTCHMSTCTCTCACTCACTCDAHIRRAAVMRLSTPCYSSSSERASSPHPTSAARRCATRYTYLLY